MPSIVSVAPAQSDRVDLADLSVFALVAAVVVGGRLVVDQFPARLLNSREWSTRAVVGETLGPEARPVIRDHLVQGLHDILERIRLHGRRPAGRTVERLAEVIE